MQLKMRIKEKEQKGILLMTGISMAGRDLPIYYVAGLALFFDLFQPVSPTYTPFAEDRRWSQMRSSTCPCRLLSPQTNCPEKLIFIAEN